MTTIRPRPSLLLALLMASHLPAALAAPKAAVCYEYQYACYTDPYQACQAVAKARRDDKSVDNPYGTVAGAKDAGDKFWCKLADKDGNDIEQEFGAKHLATQQQPVSPSFADAPLATTAEEQPSAEKAQDCTKPDKGQKAWTRKRIADIARKPKVIVGMHATVKVKKGLKAIDGLKLPAAFAQLRGDDQQVKAFGNGGHAALLPEVQVRKGHQPSSGYLLKPQAASPSTLEFVSWNTGEPVKDYNASHAEHQFYNYLSDQGAWLGHVSCIDIQVYGLDVCPQCDADFKKLQELVRGRNPEAVVSIRRAD